MKLVLWSLLIYIPLLTARRQAIDNKLRPVQVDTRLVTSDLDNFWLAYSLSAGKPIKEQEKVFDSIYIRNATPCLQVILSSQKISAIDLVRTIQAESDYFSKCRAASESITKFQPQIRSYLEKFKEIYPPAQFSDIYFLFTRFYTGGQSNKEGIAIGMDFWSLPDTLVHFNNPLLRELVRGPEMIPVTIVHEFTHRNQDIKGTDNLLKYCLKEGGADFIAYLVTGRVNNPSLYEFGNSHEKELWNRFRKKMATQQTEYWLYNNYNPDRPRDLGYWMGFKICESYYNRALDKTSAVKEILNISNPKQFLSESKYQAMPGN